MGLPKCLGGEEVVCEDVLRMPCTALGGFWTEVRLSFLTFNCIYFSVNWEDIKTEIIYSNVIQKNNVLFARKLDKTLIKVAKDGDKHVGLVK